MPHIKRIARINALREIDIRKLGKYLVAHRRPRSHSLRHNPWLLRLPRGSLGDLKLSRALALGRTRTSTSASTSRISGSRGSGAFGLRGDLMDEEAIPVVAQALHARLQAPCAFWFLLVALLSRSVTTRGCQAASRDHTHLDLPLPTCPTTLALPRDPAHLHSCAALFDDVEPLSILTRTGSSKCEILTQDAWRSGVFPSGRSFSGLVLSWGGKRH